MNTQFEKLLLSELRIVIYDDRASCVSEDDADNEVPTITDIQMVQAVTANEELMHLGYTLRPADLIRLAGSPSLTGFAEHFRSLLPDVTAPPMYPDFPKQVMQMDEAEFRLHQMIHYFSTYGLEMLLGEEVKEGWLPKSSAAPKTRRDETLLKAKVILTANVILYWGVCLVPTYLTVTYWHWNPVIYAQMLVLNQVIALVGFYVWYKRGTWKQG